MRAGQLNKQITVLAPTASKSTVSGEMTITWSTFMNDLWASVTPLRSYELYRASVMNAKLDTRIVLRYTSKITPEMKIIYDESTYSIDSVIDIGNEHRVLEILCSRVVT